MSSAAAEQQLDEGKDLVQILDSSSGPIDLARYINFVLDPAAGAIATFEGTTLDSFEGKRVVELRCEAYVPMAARRRLPRARSAWPFLRIAVVHRIGTVRVGVASVFVAASAVHPAEACRFVIDEVKASVPIWKEEVYENGEVWKENREFVERRTAVVGRMRVIAAGARLGWMRRHMEMAWVQSRRTKRRRSVVRFSF